MMADGGQGRGDAGGIGALGNVREMVVDRAALADTFRRDVMEGLAGDPKRTPARCLYDARGSELFEAITRAADYYPTRTEASIYAAHVEEMAGLIGPGAVLIEPGSGSGEKAERKLAALVEPKAFVPVEISEAALVGSVERIGARFPEVEVMPVRADFTAHGDVPSFVPGGDGGGGDGGRRVVFFPGSTIGNFGVEERRAMLASFRRVVGEGGMLLIGTDLEKDVGVLVRAYDDSAGVTAAFNLNLLERINRELGGDFDVSGFRHESRWNDGAKRIEMHLVSERSCEVRVGGASFSFGAGETIHTENSHKFTAGLIDGDAAGAGFALAGAWTDERGWFRVGLYRAR